MKEIFNRRSIRKFTDDAVDDVKVQKLLRAAMQAPSAGNQRPWEFILIRDRQLLDTFSEMCPFSKALTNTKLAILLVANEDRMRHPEFWQQDMGAAAQSILLEAIHLDLGTTWLGIAPIEERMQFVTKLLSLEDNLKPFCVIPVGYPADATKIRFVDRFEEDRIHYHE